MNPTRSRTLTLALTVLAALPAAAAPPTGAAIDAVFAEYDHPDTPGCALGVIRDGEFTYRRGYGMANLEYDIPIGSATVFRIGSTSKQFTATAIVLLADSGALSLDDPLRKFFPEFPDWARGMTVRQLLNHTSGIRDYLQLAFLAGKGDDADYYTDDWVLDLLARQRETNFAPGEQFLYSNSGYLLLAHIVKRVSGVSLRDYAAKHIFRPLGMAHTHFHDDHTEIVRERASGYAPADPGFRLSMTTLDMVGDGGVFTTIDDLLLWDRNFYANRLGGGPELIRQLTTPGKLNDGTVLDYALGLDVDEYRGLRMVSHGGAFVGYRAELIRFPDQRFSVAVLCNRSDASPSQLARSVADLELADRLAPPPAPDLASPEAAPWQPTAVELATYAGDFWEPTDAAATEVRVMDGTLRLGDTPGRRKELRPVAPDVFQLMGLPALAYVYYDRDGAGAVTGLRITVEGKPRAAFTPFERRRVDTDSLAAYAGEYYSPELDVTYVLAVDGSRLLFRAPQQEPQELKALFGETFETPDYGTFEFRRAADGTVTAFRLQSGRVKNLAFNRR